MNEFISTLIGAVIASATSITVCLINASVQKRKADAEQDKKLEDLRHQIDLTNSEVKASIQQVKSELQTELAVMNTEMKDLKEKVVKHNNFIERLYAVEKTVEVLDEKQKVANHRIDDNEQLIEKIRAKQP